MKKIYTFIGALGLLATPFIANSQVNVSEDFESGTPAGWTTNNFSTFGNGEDCDGTSLYSNIYSFSTTGDFTTTAYGATGGDIDVSFDYKIVDYSSNDATTGDWGVITLEYEVDGGGFVVLETIDQFNHVVANTCANISNTVMGVADGSTVTFRMTASFNNGDWDLYVDNFTALEVVSCPQPTGFGVVSADNSSADLTWDDPTGVPEWQIEYGAPGFTPGTGAGTQSVVTTNAANITGLTSNSFYDVYVRAICTPGVDTSGWTGALAFNTFNQGQFMVYSNECGPGYNDISGTGTPTGLGDDGTVGLTLDFPLLYQGVLMNDITIANNGTIWLGTQTGSGTTYSPNITTAANALFPFGDDIDSESGDVFYETVGTAPNRTFIVQWEDRYAWSGANAQTGVTFQVQIEEATNEIYFLYEDVVFGDAMTANDYGASAAIGASGPNQDVVVSDYDPAYLTDNSCVRLYYTNCPPPTNLAITDFTHDSLMFSWNPGGVETDWDIVWGPEGFSAPDGGTMFSTTDMADSIGMLDQLTTYDIYVRSSCAGGTDSSAWVGPLTQMTAPICPNPSGLTLDGQNVDSAFVSWTSNGTETDWNLQYGLAGFEIGSGMTMASTTIPDTITGLMGSMVYDIYVQSNCGGPDTSLWIGPLQVLTPVVNDSTCDAIDLTVDGNPVWFNNVGATEQVNETATIQPNVTGYNTQDGWGEGGIEFSTWFTFTAPASGIVEISGRDENYDGQIAVYEASDCSDLSTFTLVGANDDGYTGFGGVELTLCGLTPGNTYYLLHDNNSFEGSGVFSLSVAEISQPEAGTATDVSVCAGDIVNLNEHLAGNEAGTWESLDNPSFVFNDSLFPFTDILAYGDYTFEYTVNKRCAMDSAILVVTTVGPSSAGEVAGTVDGCFHAPVNLFDGLTGNIDLGGTWYDATDDALAGNSVPGETYDLPGAYNFTYIVSNGVCPEDTAEITVVYQDCLGLDAFEIGNVDVYPNPTNGIFNIANNGNLADFEIAISDLSGKVVYNNTSSLANGGVETIDLTSYEKGIYMISLTSEGRTNQYKIVLQ